MTRFALLALLVTAALLLLAPSAGAAQCGSISKETGEALQAPLVLKAEKSTTAVEFGGGGGTKNLVLVFEIPSGCTLTSEEGITAKPHASEGQGAFGVPEIELADSELTVEVPVDAGKFGAGKHSAAITVNSPTIVGSTTKVAFQRTEGWVLPLILTIGFGLIGVAAAVAAKILTADKEGKVKWFRIFLALGAAAIPVGAVFVSGYVEAEIWQPTAGSIAALFFAAVAAAAGPAGAAMIGEAIKPKAGN